MSVALMTWFYGYGIGRHLLYATLPDSLYVQYVFQVTVSA